MPEEFLRKVGLFCRAEAAAKRMRKEYEGRLSMLTCKAEHAAGKIAKRTAQLSETRLRTACPCVEGILAGWKPTHRHHANVLRHII